VYGLPEWNLVYTLRRESEVNCVAFDGRSRYLASGSGHGTGVWDMQTGLQVGRCRHQSSCINAVGWVGVGRDVLVVGTKDKKVVVDVEWKDSDKEYVVGEFFVWMDEPRRCRVMILVNERARKVVKFDTYFAMYEMSVVVSF